MGAHPYQYLVDYQADAQAALSDLRQATFHSGAYYGAHKRARTPEEALELSDETGTRSILDITRVTQRPACGCAAPFTQQELESYFGTPTPTVAMVEECDALWEDLERGQARYLAIYDNGVPRQIMFVGYSFD